MWIGAPRELLLEHDIVARVLPLPLPVHIAVPSLGRVHRFRQTDRGESISLQVYGQQCFVGGPMVVAAQQCCIRKGCGTAAFPWSCMVSVAPCRRDGASRYDTTAIPNMQCASDRSGKEALGTSDIQWLRSRAKDHRDNPIGTSLLSGDARVHCDISG